MPNERPEFRPIEIAPKRNVWPYAVLGAVIAGLVLYIARQNVAAAQPKQVALASVAPKIEPLVQAEAAKATAQSAAPVAKPAEGPNVIGSAVAAAGKLAMVARSELDREL